MLRLSVFCLLLASAVAQNGYDYNKPYRPFGPGTSSIRPGTSPGSSIGTTTSYPIRPQNDDFNGPGETSTGYPTGLQNYPGSSSQRPGYQDSYPQGPSGQSGYPEQYNSYSGSRGPTGFPGQGSRYPGSGSRYPGQGQSYPGQPGSSFGPVGFADDTGNYEGGDYSAIPGEPDIDYPVLSYIPQTSFNCENQLYPGYYADVETRCQVFHVCSNNKTYDFLCPNGTVFSQEVFVCVWWNEFSCDSAPSLYELNAKLYDYSTKTSPGNYPVSNFNDYQGSSYPSTRRPQAPSSYPGTQRTSTYPSSGPQGPSTPYPSGPGSYPSSQSPSGIYPGYQGPSGSYPGSQGPSSNYPGSQEPSGNYPGSQSPSGSYPGIQGPSSSYPGSQGPADTYPGIQDSSDSYPGTQGPSVNYPSSQSTSGSYPGSQGTSNGYPGSYPSGPQGPSGSTRRPGYPGTGPSSTYPGSGPGTGPSSSYPGSNTGSQGYPSGRPNGSSLRTGGNRRRPVQKPNREYLPPRN